jgi:hypothetical protein
VLAISGAGYQASWWRFGCHNDNQENGELVIW